MPRERPLLTERHLLVLRWIADGCPNGVWPDHSHKLLVGRLETLNLAAVRRWYGKWNAVIQPDGEYYLEHGHYPHAQARIEEATRQPVPPTGERCMAPPPRVLAPKEPSPTEQLVARILAAGGALTVTPDGEAEHRKLEAQIAAVQRHNKTPSGTQLVVERSGWSTFVLKIVDLPAWMAQPAAEVPVPARLRNLHEAVLRLRGDEHLLAITGAPRRRALLLLQALAAAAAKRGYAVKPVQNQDGYGRPQRRRDHLSFTVAGHDIRLRIAQLSDRSAHVPTTKELAEKQQYSFSSIRRYDDTPSDRLKIEITTYRSGAWTDGVRNNLEDRLPEILRAIERAADAAERALLAAEERKRQQQLEEERRVATATRRMIEGSRAKVFEEQVAAWYRAKQYDEYVEALAAVVDQIEDPLDGVAAAAWLGWVREHVHAVNPLHQKIAMPSDPEPTRAALEPYMDRPRHYF